MCSVWLTGYICLGFCLWRLMLDNINQNEDQGAVFGSHFEVPKRGEIDQRHCTSIGDSLYNNLECLEKLPAYWATDIKWVEQGKWQQLMTKALWELWRKTPKHQSVTSRTLSTGQGWRHLSQPFKEDFKESNNIEAIAQDANHSSQMFWNKVLWWEAQWGDLWSTVEEVSWLQLVWLRLEWAH